MQGKAVAGWRVWTKGAACWAAWLPVWLLGPAASASASAAVHEGVASCADANCHGRPAASGLVVRQNELFTWQDPASAAGAHSRAWRILALPRARAIAGRLRITSAQTSTLCMGCHADPAPTDRRGPRFQVADGVGCEACHGGSGDWLASHYVVGASHAGNVGRGLVPLEQPKARVAVCLDCHLGGAGAGQFVSHRLMSAGHPRLSFELDLFSSLQRHYDLDARYARRKAIPPGIQVWAIGQAMALDRSLGLFSTARGQDGAFPEFSFFDCHSCHRAISDEPTARPRFEFNSARPIPSGMPPFNDENMILLAAAARVAAPNLADRFDIQTTAFHAALARDRASAQRAAGDLARTARRLADAFASQPFGRGKTLAMLDAIVDDALTPRFTDYTGGAQAVMAIDTLLTAATAAGEVSAAGAQSVRPAIERAYAAVRDPNEFHPAAFRGALQQISADVRRLS